MTKLLHPELSVIIRQRSQIVQKMLLTAGAKVLLFSLSIFILCLSGATTF